MAAGVHLARNFRFIWELVGLLDRQRIHVGAQSDRLARATLAASDDANYAGTADA